MRPSPHPPPHPHPPTLRSWAFDVELVFLATRLRIAMVEVPVHWEEIDGSKIDIVSDSLKMARDIMAIRTAYTIGVWKDSAPEEEAPLPLSGASSTKSKSAASARSKRA